MTEPASSPGARLLRAWERGLGVPPSQRAAALLCELDDPGAQARLHAMTVGECERRLFEIRAALFGEQIAATVTCEDCGQRFEIGFCKADVVPTPDTPVQRLVQFQYAGDLVIEAGVPTLADLSFAADAGDATSAASIILRRCIRSARHADRDVDVESLPRESLEELQRQLERADPCASVELQVCCPSCGHEGESPFDMGSFLWKEVEAEALRLLRDVHVLAREYCWREVDILGLSPARRRMYLEMAGT